MLRFVATARFGDGSQAAEPAFGRCNLARRPSLRVKARSSRSRLCGCWRFQYYLQVTFAEISFHGRGHLEAQVFHVGGYAIRTEAATCGSQPPCAQGLIATGLDAERLACGSRADSGSCLETLDEECVLERDVGEVRVLVRRLPVVVARIGRPEEQALCANGSRFGRFRHPQAYPVARHLDARSRLRQLYGAVRLGSKQLFHRQ